MSTVTWIEVCPICSFTYMIGAPPWRRSDPKVCLKSKPNLPQPGLGQNWLEVSVLKIVRVEDRSFWGRKDQIVRNIILASQVGIQQSLISEREQYGPQFARQSPRRLFLLFVVVYSRRT